MPYHLIPLPLIVMFVIIATVLRYQWIKIEKAGDKVIALKKHTVYGFFKIFTHILVITTGILGIIFNPTKSYLCSMFVLAGLIVSLFGDLAMYNIKSDRIFITGLFIFFFAISLYAVAFSIGTGFILLDFIPIGFMCIVFIILLFYFLPNLKHSFFIPFVSYGIIWCFLISRAFALFYSSSFSIVQATLVSFGTIIFFYDDIRLAIWKLKNPNLSLASEPATYAIGQTCIALSLAYFPS